MCFFIDFIINFQCYVKLILLKVKLVTHVCDYFGNTYQFW